MTLDRDSRSQHQRSERRRKLIDAGLRAARAVGFARMTRGGVAVIAGLANGTVNHEFGTMAEFREAVMQEAVDRRDLSIIGQGLAVGSPIARAAPPEVRADAVTSLI